MTQASGDQGRRVVESRAPVNGYTAVENEVLFAADLSPGARLLYSILKCYSWKHHTAWPGQELLAANLGLTSPRQVRRYLLELEDAGLLSMERRGLTQTNVYRLHAPSVAFAVRRRKNDMAAPDGTNMSHQERTDMSGLEGTDMSALEAPSVSALDGTGMTDKETVIEETVIEETVIEESGRTRFLELRDQLRSTPRSTPPAAAPAEPPPPRFSLALAAQVSDLCGALGVGQETTTVGQVLRLWSASGLDEAAFAGLVREAGDRAQRYQGGGKLNCFLSALHQRVGSLAGPG
jgi:hypothetical protein